MTNSTEEIEMVHCEISGDIIPINEALELTAYNANIIDVYLYMYVSEKYRDMTGLCEMCGKRTLLDCGYNDNYECDLCANKRGF